MREIESLDWIAITLVLCLLILAISKRFSKLRIADLLSAFVNTKVIKVTKSSEDKVPLLVNGSLVIYAVGISLLSYVVYIEYLNVSADLNTFLICFTLISVYLLAKYFLGKLVASLGNFEELLDAIDHHRNIYRAAQAYLLLALAAAVIYIFNLELQWAVIALVSVGLVVLIYNLVIVYLYRRMILASAFYFILYLCTLEISPYLLLYKYFMG